MTNSTRERDVHPRITRDKSHMIALANGEPDTVQANLPNTDYQGCGSVFIFTDPDPASWDDHQSGSDPDPGLS